MDRRSLLSRVLTAAVGIPLLLGAAWLGDWYWTAIIAALSVVAAIEYVRLVSGVTVSTFLLGLAVVLLVVGRPVESGPQTWIIAIGTGLLFAGGILPPVLAGSPERAGAMGQPGGATLLGWAYVGTAAGVLIQWGFAANFAVLLWIFTVIWANDIAAYFIGHALGRHKLAPHLSPGKSWEGAIAGLLAGIAIGAGFAPWLELPSRAVAALAGGLVTVAAQLGDLFESAIKRRAGVKDSGVLFPGHGGALDRFDGVFAAAPVAYLLLHWWAS